MADTPSLPHDAREQPILDNLLNIRDELILLKQDKTSYVKSSDVMRLYDKVIDQVKALTGVRSDNPQEQNRVDRVLDTCFQLISLFFMTIGKTNEAPAAYALTSTIKRLLDHLTEVDLYSVKDLDHIAHTLNRLRSMVKKADSPYPEKLVTLLSSRLDVCQGLLENLENRLGRLGDGMPEIHEKLISILRSMALANTRAKFSRSEVVKLQAELKETDGKRKDGKFLSPAGEVAKGNDEVCDLLERLLFWADFLLSRKPDFPEEFKPQYDVLVDIRNKLEKLSLTQAWSLRETDLYDYQRTLDKYDESRVDGKFIDADGNFGELYVQRTLLYLLRRSYAYIYFLMVSSEPVSEALLPVYNQLQTLKRCLIEVKNSGGVSSPRELYPYSMKLNSIDNMRVEGKFMVGPDIPEGQGSVNDLLAQCFDLAYDLRVAAESADEE